MSDLAYQENLETAKRLWKHDRALDVLKLLEGNPLPEAVALKARVDELLHFFWDKQAYEACYSEQAGETMPGSHVGLWRADWIVDRVKRLAELDIVRSVIDIGVGYGEMTVRFATEVPQLERVVGADMCKEFLAKAYAHPKIEYHLEYAEELTEEADNSFDVAVLSGVLEHVRDYDKAISEAERVVLPGGYIFFSAPYGGGLGFYGNPDITYLLHVREVNPFELVGRRHCEIDWYDQTKDKYIWFARNAKADGEELGEYAGWYTNDKSRGK